MKLHQLLITTSLFMAYQVFAAGTEPALPDGDQIAANINARDEGQSLTRILTMTLTDRRGKQRIRKTKSLRKYFADEKRTVIFYLSPKNIKHTAFLIYDYSDPGIDDDQWLYLPAMRRVRRISAADRGDYFLGTGFTYEDIKLETRVSLEDYDRKTVGQQVLDGFACYQVESVTKNEQIAKELGHSKRLDCVDGDIWMTRKSQLWDNKGEPLKTIYFKDIRQVQGIWTAHVIEVENHKTQHHTVFTFSEVDYATELDAETFTQQAIRRGL